MNLVTVLIDIDNLDRVSSLVFNVSLVKDVIAGAPIYRLGCVRVVSLIISGRDILGRPAIETLCAHIVLAGRVWARWNRVPNAFTPTTNSFCGLQSNFAS